MFHDTFNLRKDQIQRIDIHANGKDHRLAFRWTLFVGGQLVMHVVYDGRPFQPLLYRDYKRDTYRVDLFAKPKDATPLQYETPHALLMFTAFDVKKKEAWIDVKIYSDEGVRVKYKKGQ